MNDANDRALSEGMMVRRVLAPNVQAGITSRMTQAGPVSLAACRELRLYRRGEEFVAAARAGFEQDHAAERRAFWRQRAAQQVAKPIKRAAAGSAHSLRLLLRSLATRESRGNTGASDESSVGQIMPRRSTRPAVPNKVPQVAVAAAGSRRGRSFRDHQFGRRGLSLMERGLRAKARLQERLAAGKGTPPKSVIPPWMPGGKKSIEPKKPQ